MSLKQLKLCLVVLLLFTLINQIVFAIDLDLIIEGVKYNNSLIQTGRGDLTVESTTTEYGKKVLSYFKDKRYQVSYTFSGQKIRCELNSELIQVFDGEKFMEFDKRTDPPRGRIRAKNIILSFCDPRYWGIRFWDEELGKYLEKYAIKVIGYEKIKKTDKTPCYVILARLPNETENFAKFWIDINQGYRPRKIEWISSNPKLNKTDIITTHIQYQKHQKDIWFPKSGWYTFSRVDPKTGKAKPIRKFSMIKNVCEINADISEEVFKIDFPSGTSVTDFRM